MEKIKLNLKPNDTKILITLHNGEQYIANLNSVVWSNGLTRGAQANNIPDIIEKQEGISISKSIGGTTEEFKFQKNDIKEITSFSQEMGTTITQIRNANKKSLFRKAS